MAASVVSADMRLMTRLWAQAVVRNNRAAQHRLLTLRATPPAASTPTQSTPAAGASAPPGSSTGTKAELPKKSGGFLREIALMSVGGILFLAYKYRTDHEFRTTVLTEYPAIDSVIRPLFEATTGPLKSPPPPEPADDPLPLPFPAPAAGPSALAVEVDPDARTAIFARINSLEARIAKRDKTEPLKVTDSIPAKYLVATAGSQLDLGKDLEEQLEHVRIRESMLRAQAAAAKNSQKDIESYKAEAQRLTRLKADLKKKTTDVPVDLPPLAPIA